MKRSDGNREIDRHRDVLERIVAMLFLLAGLADLAIGLPARRRLRVFSILACGEAEARGFVMGLAGAPVEDDASLQDAISAGDAERLAVSFRVLALVLGAMLAQVRRPASAGGGGRQTVLLIARRRSEGPAPSHPPFRTLPPPDT